MHAYHKPIVTIAVLHAQQDLVILALHRRMECGVLFPVMHAFDSILEMALCNDSAVQHGLSGQSSAGV